MSDANDWVAELFDQGHEDPIECAKRCTDRGRDWFIQCMIQYIENMVSELESSDPEVESKKLLLEGQWENVWTSTRMSSVTSA